MKKTYNSIFCDEVILPEKSFNISTFDKVEILNESIEFSSFEEIDLTNFSIFNTNEILDENEIFFIHTKEKTINKDMTSFFYNEMNIEISRIENTIKDIYQKVETSIEKKIEVKYCGQFFSKEF